MNNQPISHLDAEKKPSWAWIAFKKFSVFLFPGIKLLKINKDLRKANRIMPHSWFARQRKLNLLVSLVVSLPLLASLGLCSRMVYVDKELRRNLNSAQIQLSSWEIGRAYTSTVKAFTNEKTAGMVSMAVKVLAVGMFISFILGTLVLFNHQLLTDTGKLRAMLIRNGVFDKGDTHRLVLATPLGFLIDVTGNTGREVKDNERIWMALNQRVTDWVEDPDQRSICFFKKAYQLKKAYVYKF